MAGRSAALVAGLGFLCRFLPSLFKTAGLGRSGRRAARAIFS